MLIQALNRAEKNATRIKTLQPVKWPPWISALIFNSRMRPKRPLCSYRLDLALAAPCTSNFLRDFANNPRSADIEFHVTQLSDITKLKYC